MRRRRGDTAPTPQPEAATQLRPQLRTQLRTQLLEHVHAPGLVWFRRAFAAGIVYDAVTMVRRHEMEEFFTPPRLTLTYAWAPASLRPLSAELMTWMPHLHAAAAVAFGTGAAPRTGLLTFVLSYTFVFLCEASRYVNHYYLYCLLGALLLAAACSGDGGARCCRVHLWLLRAQFSLVFAFGASAKCSREFVVRGEPLRTYVQSALRGGGSMPALRQLNGLVDAEWAIAAGALFALAFDLVASFALWSPRWRWRVAAVAAAFHGANSVLFSTIGSFPFVSMAACALFADAPAQPAAPLVGIGAPRAARDGSPARAASGTLALSAAWLAWQTLVPLRHLALTSDVSWSKRGDRFAWRMMADTTDGFVTLWISNPADGRESPAHPMASGAPVTLTPHAIQQLLAEPSLLEQWVRAETGAAVRALSAPASGSGALQVTADCWKSVNRRPYQRWCDPRFDFGAAPRPAAPAHPWMLPRRTRADGGPGEAEHAATEAAAEWRARGFRVEAFVDAGGRPEWRDRILRGPYGSAALVCTHGRVVLTVPRPTAGAPPVRELRAAESASLRIGEWHGIRAESVEASWLYVMQ